MDQALAYANDGYVWVVDVDLAQFFYTVSHGKLLQVLSKRVKDRWVVKLVHKMLRAPVSENGVVEKREIGTPQGGPVCPVLANIRASRTRCRVGVAEPQVCPLRRRPHGAVSKQEGRRAHDRAPQALHRRKALPADQCREDEDLPHHGPELKFLGFGFWAKVRKGDKPLICDRPHQKSLAKCKAQLRDLTSRSRGQSLDVFREKLRRYVVGWAGYFGRASMARFVADANQWLRRRIRMVYWKQWKKPSMRLKALRKLGVPEGRAHEWANSRKGYWRIAGSWVLSTSLDNAFLRRKGWVCLQDVYRRHPAS